MPLLFFLLYLLTTTGAGATASADPITQDSLYALTAPATGAPRRVVISNRVIFTRVDTIAAGVVLDFRAGGSFDLSGLPLGQGRMQRMVILAEIEAAEDRQLFFGASQLPFIGQRRVSANWFGARADGVVDPVNQVVLNTDYTHNYHAFRQAALAVTWFGTRTDVQTQITYAPVTDGRRYVWSDTTHRVRQEITGYPDERWRFTQAQSGFKWVLRLRTPTGKTEYLLLHNLLVGDTTVTDPYLRPFQAPNQGSRSWDHPTDIAQHTGRTFLEEGGCELGLYGETGDEDEGAQLVMVRDGVPAGTTYLVALPQQDLSRVRSGDHWRMNNGASYDNQWNGQYNTVAAVRGDSIHFRHPFVQDLSLYAHAWRFQLLQPFVQPAPGATVQITTTQQPGGGRYPYFTLGNNLYERLSEDGDGRYTVRLLGTGNKNEVPPGTRIPAGTRGGDPRGLIRTPLLVTGARLAGLALYTRRDGVRWGKNMHGGLTNVVVHHAQEDPTYPSGLTLSLDGGYAMHLRRCTLTTNPGQLEIAQVARSSTLLEISDCDFRNVALEVIEFSKQLRFVRNTFYLDALNNFHPRKHNYQSPREVDGVRLEPVVALKLGVTGGGHLVHDNRFELTGAVTGFSSTDIAEWRAAAGSGPTITNNRIEANYLETLYSLESTGGLIANNTASGRLRTLYNRTGGAPLTGDSTGISRGDYSAYSVGGPTRWQGNTYTGHIDQALGQAPLNTEMDDRITRSGPTDYGADFANARGAIVQGGGKERPVSWVRLHLVLEGWEEGLDEQIKDDTRYGPEDYLLIELLHPYARWCKGDCPN